MKDSGNRFAIKKNQETRLWDVVVDGKRLVSFETWAEARAMVSYQVRVRPVVEKNPRGWITLVFDIFSLIVGVVSGVILLYFGLWGFLPISIVFIMISIRGFILKDWHHVSSRIRYRK